MIDIDIEKARKRFNTIISSSIKNDVTFKLNTKEGSVVLLSEKSYRSLIESFYLMRMPGVYKDIKRVNNTPTSRFIKNCRRYRLFKNIER